MTKNIYLALVDDNFDLTDEVRSYFYDHTIEVIRYHNKLGIIILQSSNQLKAEELDYVTHLELDQIISISEEE